MPLQPDDLAPPCISSHWDEWSLAITYHMHLHLLHTFSWARAASRRKQTNQTVVCDCEQSRTQLHPSPDITPQQTGITFPIGHKARTGQLQPQQPTHSKLVASPVVPDSIGQRCDWRKRAAKGWGTVYLVYLLTCCQGFTPLKAHNPALPPAHEHHTSSAHTMRWVSTRRRLPLLAAVQTCHQAVATQGQRQGGVVVPNSASQSCAHCSLPWV